jgi:hypothetical protein
MLRAFLVLTAAVFVAAPALAGGDHHDRMMGEVVGPYGAMERPLPSRAYRELYRLTPREYRRLRAEGFRPQEVYMIANAATITGLDPSYFENAIYRGMYSRQIAYDFGLTPHELTRVRAEWKTPEWAAAIGEPALNKDRLDMWW